MTIENPTGYVIYKGPSLLDGKPIVVVCLCRSTNGKTGNMMQTYIIRSDLDPRDANRTGEDYSVCGNCKLRGIADHIKPYGLAKERGCYVNMGQGPLIVWRGLLDGIYPLVSKTADIAALGYGKDIRLGTYGDPAAVPSSVWDILLRDSANHTGYSHQARTAGNDYRPDLMMRSVDTLAEAALAWGRGERTYRLLREGQEPMQGYEIACPSLQGIKCKACGLCGGTSVKAKSITIPAHGTGATHINSGAV